MQREPEKFKECYRVYQETSSHVDILLFVWIQRSYALNFEKNHVHFRYCIAWNCAIIAQGKQFELCAIMRVAQYRLGVRNFPEPILQKQNSIPLGILMHA